MNRQVQYQRNRRAKGLCGWGGCKLVCETYYCAEHGNRIATTRKGRNDSVTRQKARREQGLCGYSGCAVVTGDDSYYCAAHAPRRAGE